MVVHGRVQGVGFRLFVARHAKQRSVAGWVRNRPDGTVEALFEGEAEDVDALVGHVREGPRGAEVARVEVADEAPDGLSWFEVR